MKPTSVTPTLAPREADDTAICERKSLAEPSGYGHRSAASPPAARDSRGRLRRDGPRARLGSCSGRSSSSRLHLRWRRASLVVLALLALVVAPGTTFVTATESGKGPRGRRLAQANPVPDLHLVADDITDVDASNLVQSWSDTGNGLSLSSFVSAPELVDGDNMSTGALFNGHKAVRFGKSGITGLSLPTSALQLSTSLEGMTVVAVVRTDSRDATAPVLFDRGFRGNRGFGFIISPAKVDIYSPLDHGGRSRTNTAPPIESGMMYVVTTQWKFAKSGVGGYQLATTQHGDLSNPDLLPVEAITWTGTGVDYSTPFVIGAQSKSYKRHEGRWLEGYVAEFRYYFQVLHQNEVTAIQDELLDKYGGRIKVSERAKLTAGDGAANDWFGNSVSIDGNTMVIGAYGDDDMGSSSGSAYVFTRDTPGDPASSWTQLAKLTAGDGAESDQFGNSVSIDGGTVVIGAYLDDDKGSSSGSAYVFSLPFPHCDASAPPANGAIGDCTSALESGSSCQPTCDPGYAASGPSTCEGGYLRPAFCTMYPQRAKLTGS